MTELRYALHGEIDIGNAAELDADLQRTIAATDAHVLVDCTHLTFIDSSGVRVLLQASQSLEAQGRRMLLANLTRNCRKVFDILGVSDMYSYERPRIVVNDAACH